MASSEKKSVAEANLLGKRKSGDDLEMKPVLRKHKKSDEQERTEGFSDRLEQIKSDLANLTSVKKVDARKKTLFVTRLSRQTKISDIINFFENEAVSVRLIVNHKGVRAGYGFVDFASVSEAKKALERKSGELLCGHNLFLDVAETTSCSPKFCLDHKVWYEDYLKQESIVIEEEDKTVEEQPSCDEEVAARQKTLFVANLSHQTKLYDIKKFFKIAGIFNHGGDVVSVRLIVDHEGDHVGCCFVEYASAYGAKKALEEKNGEYLCGHKLCLQLPQIAPYPPQHKYTLAEMLLYEDYFLRKEEDDLDDLESKEISMVGVFRGKKTTYYEEDGALKCF